MISVRARVAAVVAVLVVAMVGLNAGPPHGSPSPVPTALATPSDPFRVPTVPAAAALLADLDTGQILYAKDPRAPRPIASVTKMMTALLTLETLPLDHVVRVDPRAVFDRDDFGASSTLGLRAGERISIENLLYALLLGSANDAADALAIAVDGSIPAFVRHMNDRARRTASTTADIRRRATCCVSQGPPTRSRSSGRSRPPGSTGSRRRPVATA